MCFLNENIIFKYHTNVKLKPSLILKPHGDSVSLEEMQPNPYHGQQAVSVLLISNVLPTTNFSRFCFKVLN